MDEPQYCTDSDLWRKWRAGQAVNNWRAKPTYNLEIDFDDLIHCIIAAMKDELEEYQNDHAYDHAGLDA